MMEQLDLYKDLLNSEIMLQTFLNNEMVKMNNPVARQVFTRMRDDDMTHIILLQQIIESRESSKEPVQIIPPKS